MYSWGHRFVLFIGTIFLWEKNYCGKNFMLMISSDMNHNIVTWEIFLWLEMYSCDRKFVSLILVTGMIFFCQTFKSCDMHLIFVTEIVFIWLKLCLVRGNFVCKFCSGLIFAGVPTQISCEVLRFCVMLQRWPCQSCNCIFQMS